MKKLKICDIAASGSRRLAGLSGLVVLLVLGGCATPANPRDDAAYQSYANAANRPTVRPVRSVSSFSDSLMCMDRMFREAQIPLVQHSFCNFPEQ